MPILVSIFLKEKRETAGLSISDLASELGDGIHESVITAWEGGICLPPSKVLAALARILDIDPRQLSFLIFEEVRWGIRIQPVSTKAPIKE